MDDLPFDIIILTCNAIIIVFALAPWVSRKIQGWRRKLILNKWSIISKESGKLYVHCEPSANKKMPSVSPFTMKVLTFLRMSGIPHELEHTNPLGDKGKTPWVSLNGENVSDSELIVDFLQKTYGTDLNGHYTPEEIAVAKSVRVMLEGHAFWGMMLERFVYGKPQNRNQVLPLNWFMAWGAKKVVKTATAVQGIGLNNEKEVVALISTDLQTVSQILAGRKFILGEEPCVEDAAIFGQLSQFIWGLPNSPYESLFNDEH